MKKVRKFLKGNIKLVIGLIIGAIVSGAGVYAASETLFASREVGFDNTKANLTLNGESVDNVQDALDALYEKAKNSSGCPNGYIKQNETNEVYICNSSNSLKFINNNYIDGSASGLVAINTDGNLCTSSCSNPREYRYSGGETIVNNWIKFAGENWRIIGIFKGETSEGSNAWNIKIIREEGLPAINNSNYTAANGASYTLGSRAYSSIRAGSHSSVQTEYSAGLYYWNYGGTNSGTTDWNNAGINAYLNDNKSGSWYYDTFKKSGAAGANYEQYIAMTTYYLNTVDYSTIPKNAYTQERTGSLGNYHGGIWSGKIGLPYASDYGYATDSTVWNGGSIVLNNYKSVSNINTRNWFLREYGLSIFLLSPSSYYEYYVLYLNSYNNGNISASSVDSSTTGVRPVLSLTSDTPIVSGTGAWNDPYKIIAGS